MVCVWEAGGQCVVCVCGKLVGSVCGVWGELVGSVCGVCGKLVCGGVRLVTVGGDL